MDTNSSKINSSQSLTKSSLHYFAQSLSPIRSDTSHSDVSSFDDDFRDNQCHDVHIKSSSTHQSIKGCQSNKLSFGISRLLSSKDSDSKCIANQTHHNSEANEFNKLKVNNSSLNKYEKSNESVRVPGHHIYQPFFNYSNPFSWLNPQISTSFLPKNRLSGNFIFYFN